MRCVDRGRFIQASFGDEKIYGVGFARVQKRVDVDNSFQSVYFDVYSYNFRILECETLTFQVKPNPKLSNLENFIGIIYTLAENRLESSWFGMLSRFN